MIKKIYYTNGINEVRILPQENPPLGWVRGRVKSPVTTYGFKWYTNGIDNVMLSPDEEIPSGYTLGRTITLSWSDKSHTSFKSKKYHHYTNGENEILIAAGDSVPDGYLPGRNETSPEVRKKLSNSHLGKTWSEETKMKSEQTKRLNNSFNTSNPEKGYYTYLCGIFGKNDVMTNYRSDVYPHRCDFYIKSLDKYIELNLHWTHGGRPYDPNDEECQKQLAIWQEKAKTSKFYLNAIRVWTVLDVKKFEDASKNQLNYEALYTI